MANAAIKCPKCGSTKIFRFRLDSDWAYGAGEYHPVNGSAEYDGSELAMDATDRPDIDLYHCLACDMLWDATA